MFFKDIIGQKEIKQQLIQSVKDGYIPHARLISGPEGVGKFALALAYARYLNCRNRKEEDSCGHCPSCIKYNKLEHPDLHFVFPIIKIKEKKKEICDDYLTEWRSFVLTNPYINFTSWLNYIEAANKQPIIYSNESEEIIRKLNLKAYESEYKIMIIWLPEKMHESCSNKLLKMIEEPPFHTVFLLVSDNPELIITTIQSRTQLLPVPPILPEDMDEALSSIVTNDSERSNLVHLANGNYLKAIEIISTGLETKQHLEMFKMIMRNSWQGNVKNMKTEAEKFAGLGRERQKHFLAYSQNLLRENFLFRLNLPEINYLNSEERDFAYKFSPYITENNVEELMEELASAEKHIESNVNPRMVFFDLSMKIAVLIKKQ